MEKRGRTSIVVLNYNGKHFLKDCLDSLYRGQSKPGEVILVDNHSTDGSVEFVEENYPKVKILEMSRNIGFAPAVNRGLKVAQGELIVSLNNDTVVEREWLSELEKAADNYPEAGFFASKMVWLKDPQIIDSAGIVYSWKGKAYDRGKGGKDTGQYRQPEFVFGACNGASCFRRETLKKVGFLDENFFLICDDVDFSFRAQLAGIKCLFVPTAVVLHAGGGTVSQWTDTKAMYSARHHIYIVLKNFPLKFLLLNCFPLLVERLRNLSGLIKSSPPRQVPALICKTYGEAIRRLPEMLRKRRKIQASRQVSDAYLISLICRANFSTD